MAAINVKGTTILQVVYVGRQIVHGLFIKIFIHVHCNFGETEMFATSYNNKQVKNGNMSTMQLHNL